MPSATAITTAARRKIFSAATRTTCCSRSTSTSGPSSVGEGLKAIGIAPDAVEDVIVTHLHYDHTGNYELFPRARYHLQDCEMAYATGRCMCHGHLRLPFEADDVVAMVRKVFAGRVTFHDGDDELAPGITLHRIGGHSRGLQSV